MEILNYTVYSSEDIKVLYDALYEYFQLHPSRLSPSHGPDKVETGCETLIIVYWQGQRREQTVNVKPVITYDPERGGHALRIKRPERLNVAPIELLALQRDEAQLPLGIGREVVKALTTLFGYGRAGAAGSTLLPTPRIRLHVGPDRIETKAEQSRRVKAKKVRKAVDAATSIGLRLGPNIDQLKKRVKVMEEVVGHLDEKQFALLEALRTQLAGMNGVAIAAAKLKGHYPYNTE